MRAADAALYRAKRNGGGQIFTAGSRASDVTPRPERRTLRRTTQERIRDAVHELTQRFCGDLAHEGPLERIEAVAVALSEALNTAAWAISFAPAGGSHHPHGRDRRRARQACRGPAHQPRQRGLLGGRVPGHRGPAGQRSGRVRDQRRRPDRGPGRARAARAVRPDQRARRLRRRPRSDLAARAVRGRTHRAARGGAGRGRLLLRAAIPPRSASKGATLRDRWAQQVGLTNALGARLAEETSVQSMVEADGRRGAPRDGLGGDGLGTSPRRRPARADRGTGRVRGPERPHDARSPRPARPLPARAARRPRRRRDARARLHQHA